MRPLAGGTNVLLYNIYLDPAASLVLGDGSSGTIAPVTAITRDTPWNMTIFGRIPANQDVNTGSYSDLLTVTIEW
jgi:spore coat protein U-like protein